MAEEWISRLCTAVDAGTMMRHLEEFSKRVKLSGTPQELESFRYLQAVLDGYGYDTDLVLHDAYISLPGKARIDCEAEAPDCITHSFSQPSPPGGLHGVVVYGGNGRAEDFAAIDARGKIVLLDGMANPSASRNASQAGAIGQIHISPHEHLHEMCVSPVWGSPTQATRDGLPTTVVLTLRRPDGDALKQRVQGNAPVEVTLHAEVDTGWRKIPILVAELPGADPAEPFVMFSGHHDTWYQGVMDNGGANATMLEIARLFAPERTAWRRGLRLCFWSGHSHGRYAGSTWYADTHWHELARRCVAHVNVDSTGAKGNTVLSDSPCSAELCGLAQEAISVRGGQDHDGHRMSRAGDQSFWGVGIPSMFMGMGEQPAGSADSFTRSVFGGGVRKGAGFGWWWHTPDDTLDKMDPDLLVRDTQIYVHTIGRLLSDRVLPLDYAAAAASLHRELTKLQQALDDKLDLSGLIARTDLLREKAQALMALPETEADHVNRTLMAVGRAMVPMDYTHGDRFEHDPALPQSPYPVLDAVRQLAAASAGSDQALFLMGGARRACNRLGHALDEATEALTACLEAA
ncbi:MAG TPA: M28 family peptidase [Rhodopila sp.]|uniref:M28 family peptidase n=1 Tax=Rhodopila sp. TaxID=2480087 RepID=UPI002CB48F46|nr:M28 family peptidase [Rhodopila sp.]HVY16341.1 M28 family peptidase [Rhodopila sp.]